MKHLGIALSVALLSAASVASVAREARAGVCDTDDAGSCVVNQYCAFPDGGAILDAAPGVCQPEPCVVASDCTNPNLPICDTSQNPFACVQCISGSDCPGNLYCQPSTHTCTVNPPPVPDASVEGGGGTNEDAGEDATTPPGEAGTSPTDGATSADGAPATGASDASAKPDGSSSSGGAAAGASDASAEGGAGQDDGSLGGGAWDCDLAGPTRVPLAALGVTFGFALMLFRRKRR